MQKLEAHRSKNDTGKMVCVQSIRIVEFSPDDGVTPEHIDHLHSQCREQSKYCPETEATVNFLFLSISP